MNFKSLFLLIVVASLTLPSFETLADPPITFGLLTNIDYPGGTDTFALGINDHGNVTGYFNRNHRSPRGYVLFGNGTFSPPISNPDAYAGITYPRGINNLNTLCGYSTVSPLVEHGFVYSHGIFTDVVVDNLNTYIMKVNDAGNFCGVTSDGLAHAFINIDGVVTSFSVPGSNQTWALGMNNLNQVVGCYTVTGSGAYHGYRRDADATLSYPIDVPNAVNTLLNGINDKGQMVGLSGEVNLAYHGVFFPSPNQSAVYDHPDATDYTNFEDINNNGQICGWYFDGRLDHGFVVKVRPATGE